MCYTAGDKDLIIKGQVQLSNKVIALIKRCCPEVSRANKERRLDEYKNWYMDYEIAFEYLKQFKDRFHIYISVSPDNFHPSWFEVK